MPRIDLYKKLEKKLNSHQLQIAQKYLEKARDFYYADNIESACHEINCAVAALKHEEEYSAAENVLAAYYYLKYWQDN